MSDLVERLEAERLTHVDCTIAYSIHDCGAGWQRAEVWLRSTDRQKALDGIASMWIVGTMPAVRQATIVKPFLTRERDIEHMTMYYLGYVRFAVCGEI